MCAYSKWLILIKYYMNSPYFTLPPNGHFQLRKNGFHILNLWVFTILALYGILTGDQSFLRNHWSYLTVNFLMEISCLPPLPKKNLILLMKTMFVCIFHYMWVNTISTLLFTLKISKIKCQKTFIFLLKRFFTLVLVLILSQASFLP